MTLREDDPVALDTNQYVFGIRKNPQYPACHKLIRTQLRKLTIYLPLEIIIELNRTLYAEELRAVYQALRNSRQLIQDFSHPDNLLITQYAESGAKDGDARICAHLHSTGIRCLVSENRHFLHEIPNLPFAVVSAQ